MVFSKEGASPGPMKVEAIKQAEPPRNAKELNSFLCTVQYKARFIESYWFWARFVTLHLPWSTQTPRWLKMFFVSL